MTVNVVTTITQQADSYDLVQLADVKDELGITGADSDVLLGKMISRVSAIASAYCNRVFVIESIQDVIDLQRDAYPWQLPGGVSGLQASRWPIVDLSSVAELDDTLEEGSDFRVDKADGLLYRLSPYDGSIIPWPARPVTLAYSAGYNPIPADVADAVIRLVRNRWFAKGRDASVMQESIPDVREVRYWVATGSDAGALTPDIQDILDQYRVPVLA